MLALRSSLRRMLAPRALAHQVCSSLSTGHRQREGTFYEFCTYYLKPSNVKEFLYNFKANVHLRTAHSELVGFWTVGFGGRVNTVFHIWKYDNYAHRAAVYKALAKDKEWQEKFLIPNLPFIDKQESEITYLVPWCKMGKPPKEGVYELATFLMKPGGPALWGDAFERAVNAHVNQDYIKLIGVFHAEYGLLNRVHVLWWAENADIRAAGRHQAHEDPKVMSADCLFCKTTLSSAEITFQDISAPTLQLEEANEASPPNSLDFAIPKDPKVVQTSKAPQSMQHMKIKTKNERWHNSDWIVVEQLCWLYDFHCSHWIWLCH